MKKFSLLQLITTLLSVIISAIHIPICRAMETGWEEISSKKGRVDWIQIRQIINDAITSDYRTIPNPLPFKTALAIIVVPEKTFPDIADKFSTTFFEDICIHNEIFKKAVSSVINTIKNNITQNLTGLTINTIYASHAPFMNDICTQLHTFIDSKIVKAFDKEESYVLTAHTDTVNCIDLFAPTERAATASNDKTAIIWDLDTGKPEHILAHDYKVNSVSFRSDGLVLATAVKNAVYFWDVTTGMQLYAVSPSGYKFDNAYFSHAAYILLAYDTHKENNLNDSTMLMWQYPPNGIPTFISTAFLPISTTAKRKKIIAQDIEMHIDSTITTKDQVFYRKTKYTPHLCSIAFDNSRQSQSALIALLNSTPFKQLIDVDKVPLQESIMKELQILSYPQKDKQMHDKNRGLGMSFIDLARTKQ